MSSESSKQHVDFDRYYAFRDDQEEYFEEHGHSSDIHAYQEMVDEDNFKTKFMDHDLKTIKSMVADTSGTEGVDGVADAWESVHKELVGDDQGGGAYGELRRAVENVLEHWEGDSAEGFRREANKILTAMLNTAGHCKNAADCLHTAARLYRRASDDMTKVEEPGWFDKTMDWIGDLGQRGGEYTAEQVRNRELPPDLLAKADEGFNGAEQTSKLQAAGIMQPLAMKYVHFAKQMRANKFNDDDGGVPAPEPVMPFPTPIATPSASVPGPSTGNPSLKPGNWSTGQKPVEPKLLRDMGVHGGEQLPLTKTKIDGLQQGITGHSGPETFSNGAPIPRGGTTGPGHIGTPGIPGVPQGRLPNDGPGGGTPGRGPGGRPSVRGGIGSGSSEHGTSGGRTGGMRGMHGMGGGGGAGGKGGAAGGRGPLARAKGGVAGAPKGITGGKGPATPGGTGLGRGRGGGASEAGGRGTRGMFAGGMRGGAQRPGEDEGEEGTRPDYLVEDEEAWTPDDGRSVPRNIE